MLNERKGIRIPTPIRKPRSAVLVTPTGVTSRIEEEK